MLGADMLEGRILEEVSDRVPAEKGKWVRSSQLIPQYFEPDRRMAFPALPEDVDHLSEDANGTIDSATIHSVNQLAYPIPEFASVRLAVDHECGQRLLGVEQHEIICTP
jgi:hypothetical protein